MNDFPGLLPSDFGFKPQGKSAPMAPPSKSSSNHTSGSTLNFDLPSRRPPTSSWSSTPMGGSFDHSSLFGNPKSQESGGALDDIFSGGGAPAKRTNKSSEDMFNFDWSGGEKSAAPVYDKPVYDDEIFEGGPGMKNSGSSKYDDVFSSISSSPKESGAFDDLLGGLGRARSESKDSGKGEKGVAAFDDLIPGFGRSNSADRSNLEAGRHSKPSDGSAKVASNMMEDPFVVLESTSSSGKFIDPLEQMSKLNNSGSAKVDNSSGGGVFDDINPLDGLGKSAPAYSPEMNSRGKDRSPLRPGPSTTDIDPLEGLGKSVPSYSAEVIGRGKDRSPVRTGPSMSATQNSASRETVYKSSVRSPEIQAQKKIPADDHWESHQTLFDMPTSVGRSPPSYANMSPKETSIQAEMSPQSKENLESSDDVWLTVLEIPLFTPPTSAPPPSRPPPPRPVHISKGESGSFDSKSAREKAHEFSSFPNSAQYFQSSKSAPAAARSPAASHFDELDDFAMGRTRNNVDEDANIEEVEANSAAAAMKEAMDRAEAKFRHAKEVRERENVKAARSKEAGNFERDEKAMQDAQERALREKQERLEHERQQREREEEEREQRRLEKERERAREIEREREKARQAVERATREARERAAADARLKAERAAVGKANAEARERAERAAVQRAQAEARERAAAEAKERAGKVAAEARERANAEAREKEARLRAERAAVERAAAEARERAASAARANQQKNENDLESFFSMGSRPSSAPRPRANSSDPMFDTQFQNRQGPEAARRTSSGVSSSMRKVSSTANIVDDLSSIFGAAPSSVEFQEVEGESEERRRARLERHQRTQERAAKALAEKNERDLQTQRDQAERHRIAETLDVEIKRWAAGKEGNLRALLSTLQYVLWPECGWQPVSLTDLITAASVKKVYRKATLCIHPDKVQQKGANLQQKYIAEKVFDLLKEAWNKFNSEELF
ncbi:auxilin-related protein 2-like [Malania oleifera]|uniref:auxilin-related protein 2-like n=1 Tax=Malania oleifera TaxID=397392 RepID=UPI0025AEA6D8|nr:auxilin-related protein 2-like [Malania oleifera]